MPRRRHSLCALLIAVALAGCGGGPAAPSPTASPTTSSTSSATTAATPSPTPVAAPLTEAKTAKAFAGVAVPAGFRLDLQCPPKTAQDKQICGGPADDTVLWSASRTYLGPGLPGASGLPATVTMNLTAVKTEAAADTFYQRRIRRLQVRDGSYDIPIKRKSGTYTPGERGRGTLTPMTSGDWRGAALKDRFVLVFDSSTSKKLTSGTRVQRRGVYVLNVTWTAAKAPAISDLAGLPDRVTTALDQG